MEDKIINEGVEDSGESFVKDHGFAAIPIHFNPKEGAEKKFALVIPGIEPPLAFFRVSGDTPDELSIEEVDGHVESVSQGQDGEVIEESVDLDTKDDNTPEPEDELNEEEEVHNDSEPEEQSIDEEEQSVPEEEDSTVDHPHEDDSGNPVAGFLLGNEDVQPLVVLVKPEDDESTSDAMDRVSNDHPEHVLGSLEEATKLLGHSPLTSADN